MLGYVIAGSLTQYISAGPAADQRTPVTAVTTFGATTYRGPIPDNTQPDIITGNPPIKILKREPCKPTGITTSRGPSSSVTVDSNINPNNGWTPVLSPNLSLIDTSCSVFSDYPLRPLRPVAADSPETRVPRFCPFAFVGIDYTGPIKMRKLQKPRGHTKLSPRLCARASRRSI
ncbi:Hypothetical protein CINCED_3A020383 [Cinara cedri]|uniref:Uncharacterized protein n=1 Tax=Cinara cedri TaxID=506608 RepID=A0A5E4LZJ3_9HEMI|nr:Hypothetical protein CINCED_3A020383 [Cinara cedri]